MWGNGPCSRDLKCLSSRTVNNVFSSYRFDFRPNTVVGYTLCCDRESCFLVHMCLPTLWFLILKILIDSGACTSCMSPEFAEKHKLRINKMPEGSLFSACGAALPVRGVTSMMCDFGKGYVYLISFVIVENLNQDVIIGRDFLREHFLSVFVDGHKRGDNKDVEHVCSLCSRRGSYNSHGVDNKPVQEGLGDIFPNKESNVVPVLCDKEAKVNTKLISGLRSKLKRQSNHLDVVYKHVPQYMKKLINSNGNSAYTSATSISYSDCVSAVCVSGYVSNVCESKGKRNGSSNTEAMVAPLVGPPSLWDLLQQAHGAVHRNALAMHKWVTRAGYTVAACQCDWWFLSCVQCQRVNHKRAHQMVTTHLPVPDTVFGGWSLDYLTEPDEVQVMILTSRVSTHFILAVLSVHSRDVDVWSVLNDRLLEDPIFNGTGRAIEWIYMDNDSRHTTWLQTQLRSKGVEPLFSIPNTHGNGCAEKSCDTVRRAIAKRALEVGGWSILRPVLREFLVHLSRPSIRPRRRCCPGTHQMNLQRGQWTTSTDTSPG